MRPLELAENQILDFLTTATVLEISEIDLQTRTQPKRLLLERGGLRLHAIFHSMDQHERHVLLGDRRIDDFLDSYRNQVAAYELSRLLGMDNLPPAGLRTVDGMPGAVSLWLEGSMTWAGWLINRNRPSDSAGNTAVAEAVWQRSRDDMHVFDALINNLDRHDSNILVDSNLKLWLVDHTRSFVHERELPTDLEIERCSTQLWEGLQGLQRRRVRQALKPYLGRLEIDALMKRRHRLVKLLKKTIARRGADAVLFDREAALLQP